MIDRSIVVVVFLQPLTEAGGVEEVPTRQPQSDHLHHLTIASFLVVVVALLAFVISVDVNDLREAHGALRYFL